MTNFDQYDPELLLAAVEGELSPSQKRQIDQIRAAEPKLARLLDAMIADRRAMRALPDPTPPHWIMDEVDRQLERDMLVGVLPAERQTQALRQAHVYRRLMVYGAVAAMLAVVATVIISSLAGGGGDLLAVNDPAKTVPTPVKPDAPDKAVATHDGTTDTPKHDGGAPVEPVKPDTAVAVDSPRPNDAGPKAIDADAALAMAAEAARDPEKLAGLLGSHEPAAAPSVDEGLAKLYDKGDDAGAVRPPLLPNPTFSNRPDPRHMNLLPKLPDRTPTQPVEPTPEPDAADAPLVTPGSSLTLTTNDRAAAVKVIETLVADHGGARSTDKPAGATITYRVPESKLPALVAAIRAAMPVTVVPADKPARHAADAAPWPALVPDYLSILRQQLPDNGEEAEPMIDLPVTVTETPAR